MSLILRLALMNSRELRGDEKGMTAVKKYIINFMFPRVVNASLSFLKPELSLMYLEIISQAQLIESHHKSYQNVKMDHMDQI